MVAGNSPAQLPVSVALHRRIDAKPGDESI
jgi:hypothetical protein